MTPKFQNWNVEKYNSLPNITARRLYRAKKPNRKKRVAYNNNFPQHLGGVRSRHKLAMGLQKDRPNIGTGGATLAMKLN